MYKCTYAIQGSINYKQVVYSTYALEELHNKIEEHWTFENITDVKDL